MAGETPTVADLQQKWRSVELGNCDVQEFLRWFARTPLYLSDIDGASAAEQDLYDELTHAVFIWSSDVKLLNPDEQLTTMIHDALTELGSQQRIDEIRARAADATPGPWLWKGNTESFRIELISRAPGIWTVMSFERWGMRDAQPYFLGDDRFLHSVKDFVVYQVCPDCESKDDPRVYRQDFFEINHPDARFIAHAREDIDVLLAEIDRLRALVEPTGVRP